MGEYYTAFFADNTRIWVASSEGGDLRQLTDDEAEKFCTMRLKQETQEQSFLRDIFKKGA